MQNFDLMYVKYIDSIIFTNLVNFFKLSYFLCEK